MIVHYKPDLKERYITDLRRAIFIGNEPLFNNPRYDLYDCSISAELLCYAINEYYQTCHVEPVELSVHLELSFNGDSLIIFTFGSGNPPVVYKLTFDQSEINTLSKLIPAA